MMRWVKTQQDDGALWGFVALGADQALAVDFVESRDGLPGIDYQHCLVDMLKWEAYWRQEPCNYVPDDLADFPTSCCEDDAAYEAEIESHRVKIARWVGQHQLTSEIPAVCFEAAFSDMGHLRILQGRHRLVYLRQLGLPAFAAAIPRQRLPDFMALGLVVEQAVDKV
ncbi:hypothetical protein [Thiomicrorhabdus cannonii]|uniref:hypothetical protein n=1 Tax=Thiomicrorhabdus cannonii TaxID=2748011 RepID=UPI0015B8F71E|nr:hypothetical protein [Thiomicrorhabdus cannonii]